LRPWITALKKTPPVISLRLVTAGGAAGAALRRSIGTVQWFRRKAEHFAPFVPNYGKVKLRHGRHYPGDPSKRLTWHADIIHLTDRSRKPPASAMTGP